MTIIIQAMADALVSFGSNLNDESECITDLMRAGYLSGEIIGGIDEAVEIARKRTMPSTISVAGDAVALVLFAATWLVIYCVACPPGGVS